jgi:photosynthetic reaction center cytochrome c subunit
MNGTLGRSVALLAVGAAMLLAGCERPPVDTVQRGFRGLGMEQVYNPRTVETLVAVNGVPAALPAVPPGTPPASTVFQNVKVLGGLGVGEFTRLMIAMTQWIAPDQGCAYCHVSGDMASDALYTKVVARRMLQMTQHINADYQNHVGPAGVTCYTCHRGQPVPANVWFTNPGPVTAPGMAGNRAGQNYPAPQVGLASLPYDPFTPFLDERNPIRVISTSALPEGNRQSIKQTEWTYALMMHMSQALGVNCTFCHNSRSFAEWDASTPQRATAYYAIGTVRDLNENYLNPLRSTFPANRLGPLGDAPKVSCATCHNGVFKPLYGVSQLKDYPELAGPVAAAAGAPIAAIGAVPDGALPAAGAPTAADMVVVYFAVASFVLPEEGQRAIAPIVVLLKANPSSKATISGYHSAAGDKPSNQLLAKNRAIAVQAALEGAGIAKERLELDKPLETEANIAGEDPRARRVEVKVK